MHDVLVIQAHREVVPEDANRSRIWDSDQKLKRLADSWIRVELSHTKLLLAMLAGIPRLIFLSSLFPPSSLLTACFTPNSHTRWTHPFLISCHSSVFFLCSQIRQTQRPSGPPIALLTARAPPIQSFSLDDWRLKTCRHSTSSSWGYPTIPAFSHHSFSSFFPSLSSQMIS